MQLNGLVVIDLHEEVMLVSGRWYAKEFFKGTIKIAHNK